VYSHGGHFYNPEPFGKIVGRHDVGEVLAQMVARLAVDALGGGSFDRGVTGSICPFPQKRK
jgi:hypothetical protein